MVHIVLIIVVNHALRWDSRAANPALEDVFAEWLAVASVSHCSQLILQKIVTKSGFWPLN